MNPKSSKLLLFSVLFAVFFFGPSLASSQFGPYPLLKYGDILDFFTPLVLIPLYWALSQYQNDDQARSAGGTIFLVFASLWVMGHGLHLAANAIKHLLTDLTQADLAYLAGSLAAKNVQTLKATDIYLLTDNFDERLGHIILHSGILGLAAVLLVGEFRYHAGEDKPRWWMVIPAGALHGLTLFTIFIEGRTVLLGLPFCLIVSGYGLTAGRKWLRHRPVTAFFTITTVLCVLLLIGWCIFWGSSECGCCPEFSSSCVGWID